MTLEKWCFEQLEANDDLNEIIQRITKDHESVAILSIVSVLALEKQCISKTVLPLVTNQKILDLDYYRFTQDIRGSSTPLISYSGKQFTHKALKPYFSRLLKIMDFVRQPRHDLDPDLTSFLILNS